MEGLARLRRGKILFGVATTVTAANMEEVLGDAYVRELIGRGAMYLWYYVYRPVGADPSPQLLRGARADDRVAAAGCWPCGAGIRSC